MFHFVDDNSLILLYPAELACRILQVGPAGSSFLGPVLIEIPHVASLRRGEREIAVLRCRSAAEGRWEEHRSDPDDDRLLKVSPGDMVVSRR